VLHFEWDENKNAENIRKHGLDFNDARLLFDMPMLVDIDNREDYGETRFIGIGFLKNFAVTIVFTQPNETTVRIISLRKALKYEREQFEKYIANRLGEN
jgi:hypothetical protein